MDRSFQLDRDCHWVRIPWPDCWAARLPLYVSVLAALLLTCLARPVAAQSIDPVRECNVKAVFLYSFGRYVSWPESSFQATSDEFVIAIYGDTRIDAALLNIAKKRDILGRKIIVRRISSVEKTPACQILFVARSVGADEIASLLKTVQGRHVLVVGESVEFARLGGSVGFFVAGDTVRFAINVTAAHDQRLTLNAKILSLGKRVETSGSPTSSAAQPSMGRLAAVR